MPYTTDSPDLPDKVKALSANKKAQWVKVFNSALESCEAEDGDDCEGSAFAQANGVVFEEKAEPYVEAEDNEMYYELPRCITVASGPLASGYVTGPKAASGRARWRRNYPKKKPNRRKRKWSRRQQKRRWTN
jgi:cation transport regulator ChaB